MKAFVTGGTGFIGSYVLPRLRERGYQVRALARSQAAAERLRQAGAEVVMGDILERESMRAGMQGCDIVFHLAGWYKTGARDWMKAEAINVNGTRHVLGLAHELGVPRILYASTVAVYGDTKGQAVDETFRPAEGPFITEYDRTKWLAHYKVALPLIEAGAPIIIAMPGVVYGPGDHSMIAELMRRFYQGQLPLLPGPEFTVTWAHVADVAEGLILAAERGRPGQSYILAGPAIPLGEMVEFWAYLTGRRPPLAKVPAKLVRPLAPLAGAVGSLLPLPPLISRESIVTLGATYMARADKARSELGWQPRPPQAGMLQTFQALAQEKSGPRSGGPRSGGPRSGGPRSGGPRSGGPQSGGQAEQTAARLAVAAAIVLLLAWLLGQKRLKDLPAEKPAG